MRHRQQQLRRLVGQQLLISRQSRVNLARSRGRSAVGQQLLDHAALRHAKVRCGVREGGGDQRGRLRASVAHLRRVGAPGAGEPQYCVV